MAIEKEVSLKVTTQSDGGTQIKALVAELEKLSAQGGEAAPELQRLSAEIKQLDQARNAANAFITLRNTTSELGAALFDAEKKAATLVPGLNAAKNTTAEYSRAQEAAVRAVKQTELNLESQRRELALLKAQMREAGGATVEMVTQEHKLRDAIKATGDSLKTLKTERTEANKQLTAASSAEKQLIAEHSKATAAIEKQVAQLSKQKAELGELALKAKAAGVNLKDLTNEQGRLRSALETAASAASKQAQSLEASRTKSAQLAQAAKAAADSLNNAFAVVGVRSANAIEREIQEINQALMRLANNSKTSGAEFDRAFASGRARIEQLKNELNGTSAAVTKVGTSASAAAGMMKQLAAAYGGIELARQFIIANVELENNTRALKAVLGSAQAASKELDFLRGVANRLGTDVNGVTRQYIGLLAASKGTALEGERIREVFLSVSNALGQLGRGTVETERAFMAITQMVSKGVVSMEELRQQLGEQLPGALQAAARGLSITETQLMKMVSSGEMLTEDFLPALQKGLDATFTQGSVKVEGFQQSWNRLKQSMTDTSTMVGSLGLWKGLTDLLGYANQALQGFMATLILAGQQIGIFAGFQAELVKSLATLDFTRAKAAVQNYKDSVLESLDQVSAAYVRAQNGATLLDQASSAAAQTAMQKAVPAAQANTAAQNANADASTRSASAQQQVAQATATAGNASEKAGQQVAVAGQQADIASQGWTKVIQTYSDARDAAEKATVIANKLVDAKKFESQAAIQIAQLTGNETLIREANTAAANNNLAALQAVQQARASEAAMLRGQIAAMNEAAAAEGGLTKAKQEQLAALQKLLAEKEVDLVKSMEATQQAKVEAAARQITAETYRDNAAKLGEYRAAAEAARVEVERLVQLEQQGAATANEVADARIAAAQATALYRDALQDAAAAEERKIAAIQRDLSLSKSALQVDLERAKTSEKSALAVGREREAIFAKVQQKQIEIKIVEATIDALRKEAAQIEATVKARRAELEASGELTPAKEVELQARMAAAQAALLEAQRSEEIVKQLRLEIDAIYDTANAKSALASATRDAAAAARDEANARVSYRNGDPTDLEYKTSGGANLNFEGEMYRMGASIDEVKKAMEYVNDLFKQQMVLNPIKDAMFAGHTINRNMQTAVEKALSMARREAREESTSASSSVPVNDYGDLLSANPLLRQNAQALQPRGIPDGSQGLQQVQPVYVTINGVKQSLNVASRGDADTLTKLLQQLSEGAMRA